MATRIGRVVRVKNTKTKAFSHESDTYLAVWVKDADGVNARCLLFTDSEISKAEIRGYKNEEDQPKRSWISKLLD
jgi:hypothetical protein